MKRLLFFVFFSVFVLGCADLHVQEFSLDLNELLKEFSLNLNKQPKLLPKQKVCPTTHNAHPQKKKDLIAILKNVNDNDDLSYIDTSQIKNMSNLFSDSNKPTFNGDISCWDVSSVTNMEYMFFTNSFNQDISGWNVSSVTNMEYMFFMSSFSQDISGWDVSSVTNMEYMFSRSVDFNQDISKWDVSKVTDMTAMFSNSDFNNGGKPSKLDRWKTSINTNKTNIQQMFTNSFIASQGQYPSWCTVGKGCQ